MNLNRREFLQYLTMAAAGGIAGQGCFNGSNSADSLPNIVMIVVDTLRADHLSLAGYSRNTTPNMDRFAENAHVFNNAISPGTWTLPAYTSMLMGLHAFRHIMHFTPADPQGSNEPNHPLLPAYLRETGYHTVSVQTNGFVTKLDGDFDERHHFLFDSNEPMNTGSVDIHAVDTCVNWINDPQSSQSPFFLFLGLMEPHWSYNPNNDYFKEFMFDSVYMTHPQVILTDSKSKYGLSYLDMPQEIQQLLGPPLSQDGLYCDSRIYVAAYDGEIRLVDLYIQRVFDALQSNGLFDDAIIIITSDHGEHMAEHSPAFDHGYSLYNALLNVPLMIKLPRQTGSEIIEKPVRTIDILPTVFDYIGIETAPVDGLSLLPLMYGGDDDSDRPPISFRYPDSYSLYQDQYHLIKEHGPYTLYDLSQDFNEQDDLASSEPDLLNALVKKLEHHVKV